MSFSISSFRIPVLAACLAILLPFGLCASHAAEARERPSPDAEATIQVGIVLFEGVQIIDLAAPFEVFGQARFNVYTTSVDGKALTTAMGLKITPDYALADAPVADLLVVPGGEVHGAMKDPALLEWLRRRAAKARQVLSICTGAFILAEAGLLDGLTATTFHNALDGLAHDYPKIRVVRDQRYVDNGRIITAAGLAAGIDAALHVVARLRGETVARSVALHLEYDWQPHGGFVRAQLADRHKPAGADPELPAGTEVRSISSVGDRDRWETRYAITTTLTRDELQARIADAMAKLGDWMPMDATSDVPTRWRTHSADEGTWRVRFGIADEPGTATISVVETIERDDPASASTVR